MYSCHVLSVSVLSTLFIDCHKSDPSGKWCWIDRKMAEYIKKLRICFYYNLSLSRLGNGVTGIFFSKGYKKSKYEGKYDSCHSNIIRAKWLVVR